MSSPDDEQRKLLRDLLAFRFARRRHPYWRFLQRPAWDILLRIALSNAEGTPVAVSELRDLAVTSQSTALRIVAEFEAETLVERVQRSSDRRIIWLQLTPKGHSYVHACLHDEVELYRRFSEYRLP